MRLVIGWDGESGLGEGGSVEIGLGGIWECGRRTSKMEMVKSGEEYNSWSLELELEYKKEQ